MATRPLLDGLTRHRSRRAERRQAGERPWWDGRNVAIRPDVPGREFDAGDLVLVRTEEERDQVNVGIDRYATAIESDPANNELADWLDEGQGS